MAGEWGYPQLNQVAKLVGGFAFKSKDFQPDGVPVAKIKNVRHRDIDLSDVDYVSEDTAKASSKFLIKNGDVVISMTGSGIQAPASIVGRVARHTGRNDEFLINQRVGRFNVLSPDKLDLRYLYYFFSQRDTQLELVSIATGSANQVNLSASQIESLEVPLPPLPEQKAIAHVLGSLDDKIELNRRMNETLEGMAQALFKSWFVDFDPVIDNALSAGNPIPEPLAQRAETRRQALANGTANSEPAQAFPASFRFTEELGYIPEGWEVSTIEDCTSTIIDHRGKTPKKLGSDWSEFGHPAISAKNIKDGRIVRHDTIRYTDPDLYSKWMSEELQSGDVIMTSEAPLGEKLYLSKGKKWVLSQRLFALRANERISGIYLYRWLSSEAAKADIDGRASGTTVIGIKQSELRQVKVLDPCQNSLGAFANFSTNLEFDKENNLELSQTLAKLRDVLLPKLISGELRIPQAEKMVKEAIG